MKKCWKKLLITIFTCVFSFSTFHIAEARELSTASADSMQEQIVKITNDTLEESKEENAALLDAKKKMHQSKNVEEKTKEENKETGTEETNQVQNTNQQICNERNIQEDTNEEHMIVWSDTYEEPINQEETIEDTERTTWPSYTVELCGRDGDVDEYCVALVNHELSKLDSRVINAFVNSGWKIEVTDIDIDQVYYNGRFTPIYGGVYASTSYKEKRIIVSNYAEATHSTIHEIGHWMDWYSNYASQTEEFQNIYKEETEMFKSAYNIRNHYDDREMFADGYDRYFQDHERLASASPKLCAYLDKVIQENF